MLSVRLDKEMEAMLHAISQRKGISKSAVIKEALAMYLKKEKSIQTPYELGADLFGNIAGGSENDSATYKKGLNEKLRGKHFH